MRDGSGGLPEKLREGRGEAGGLEQHLELRKDKEGVRLARGWERTISKCFARVELEETDSNDWRFPVRLHYLASSIVSQVPPSDIFCCIP